MPASPSVSGSWARYRAPLAQRLDWLHGKEMCDREARVFADIFRARHGFRPDVERELTDGRRPMQFILIVVTIAAAILLDVRPSGAYQGPWCAVENIGQDVRYDCSMRTLEQCVSLIIAGNRGFCNPNPYYRGPEAAPSRVKRKRYRYSRQHRASRRGRAGTALQV